MGHGVLGSKPTAGVEVEIALGATRPLLQLCRECREHLEPRVREHSSEAELCGWSRSHEQRLCLGRGQTGQLRPVTTCKPVATGRPSDRLHRNTRRTESLQITMNRPDRNREMRCQLRRGELSSELENEQEGNQPGRPQRARTYMT